jgi:hypothetical protein
MKIKENTCGAENIVAEAGWVVAEGDFTFL